MFDHVTIRVADRAASEAFYETVLRTLRPETSTSRSPPERTTVDAFHRTAIAAGYHGNGAPGERLDVGASRDARICVATER